MTAMPFRCGFSANFNETHPPLVSLRLPNKKPEHCSHSGLLKRNVERRRLLRLVTPNRQPTQSHHQAAAA
jgi:hypothetical protein